MTARQEIEILIRARYPILYVVSAEELRVQEVLLEIAQQRQKKVLEWSATTGIVPAGASIQTQKNRNAPSRDPLLALDQVIDQVEPAIFVFKDLHPFLVKNQYAVIRKLKEIAQHLKNSYKTIVLVSPVLELPVELEKEITLVNFPLPSTEELSQLLDRIIREVQAAGTIRIQLEPSARARLLQAALGLTLVEAENVFAKILVTHQRLGPEHVQYVFAEKQQIVRKSGLLEYYPTTETLEHVGGLGILKDWLQKRQWPPHGPEQAPPLRAAAASRRSSRRTPCAPRP